MAVPWVLLSPIAQSVVFRRTWEVARLPRPAEEVGPVALDCLPRALEVLADLGKIARAAIELERSRERALGRARARIAEVIRHLRDVRVAKRARHLVEARDDGVAHSLAHHRLNVLGDQAARCGGVVRRAHPEQVEPGVSAKLCLERGPNVRDAHAANRRHRARVRIQIPPHRVVAPVPEGSREGRHHVRPCARRETRRARRARALDLVGALHEGDDRGRRGRLGGRRRRRGSARVRRGRRVNRAGGRDRGGSRHAVCSSGRTEALVSDDAARSCGPADRVFDVGRKARRAAAREPLRVRDSLVG